MKTYLAIHNSDKKLFLLLFVGTFFIFVLTTDGHRSSFDEGLAEGQSIRIATQTPHQLYIEGESKIRFEFPVLFPNPTGPVCQNAILCSDAFIGHSLIEAIFIFINHNFHFLNNSSMILDTTDFNDPHYVWWRNTYNPDVTFMEIFYGPLFTSLSVATFFLISRSFEFSRKISTILSLVLVFSTIMWSASQTSFNVVPMTFFVLLGFFLLKRFEKTDSALCLVLSGISLGFAFLTRPDAIIFIISFYVYFLLIAKNKNKKLKHIFSFSVPLAFSYVIFLLVDFIRFGATSRSLISDAASLTPHSLGIIEHLQHIFGLLLSPGLGLFIFAPICLTIFFSFPDFFRRNRTDCLLFTVIFLWFLVYYGGLPTWHGLVGWGPRYLLPVIPFLILPLGASLEKRKNMSLKISIITLCAFGFFFNIVYLIQDVTWFVWGQMGDASRGLYGIGGEYPLRLNPAVMWTFEFSQLTHSIKMMLVYLQADLYFLKMFGIQFYSTCISSLVAIFGYLLFKFIRDDRNSIKKPKIFE
jgi:hypothetical protein